MEYIIDIISILPDEHVMKNLGVKFPHGKISTNYTIVQSTESNLCN